MDGGLSAYKTALDRLFARTGSTSKFGLERTQALLTLLGKPHDQFRSFHVAGTNGKGSVVATLDALLSAKGFKVGRYTSPHIVDFRERIVVDDVPISEDEVGDFLAEWEPACERLGATFFEITTALAFHHFARCRVDVAVIETGLGGRLDSTNVITPVVATVTSVGIDHTEYLGDTIESIAREKAGIFKPDVPAVYGRVSESVRDELVTVAREVGADPVIAAESLYRPANPDVTINGTTFDVHHNAASETLRTRLIGKQQATNACVSLATLDVAGAPFAVTIDEAQQILPTVVLPGRFQRIGKFILDVAHNADAIGALVETLRDVDPPRPLIAVVGILRDKNWRAMMKILCPAVDCTILTSPPSAPPQRAWNPADAVAFANSNKWDVRQIDNLSGALNTADKEGKTVLVTGSFHTVGDASLVLRHG